jgi:hypothetical protein
MLPIAGTASADNLLLVSKKLGQLLVDGVRLAPITSGYYSRVAAAMIQADQTRNNGENRTALNSGFIQHGILSPSATAAIANAPAPTIAAAAANTADDGYRRGAEDAPELPTHTLTTEFGFDLQVHVPAEKERSAIASASIEGGSVDPSSPEQDALSFVEDLVQTGRVDFESAKGVGSPQNVPTEASSISRTTHTLVPNANGVLALKRIHFDCGFGDCSRGR